MGTIIEARILLFDRNGTALVEIEPALESVVWRLNGVGQARFVLPWTDPGCTQANLRLGNRVLIQFAEAALPDWGGVIDTPRSWEQGSTTITAYTGEQLLSWRVTDRGRYFSQAAPGYVFESLIAEENAERPTGLTVGTIYKSGTPRTLEYHYHNLLKRVQDLVRLTGQDFDVTPQYSGGRLSFLANWHKRRGTDRSATVRLVDGQNVHQPTLDEQGTIASRVICVGEGTTWGPDRTLYVAEDSDSRQSYGYREYAEVQTGVAIASTLEANAKAILDEKRNPATMITLHASNQAPGLFEDYDIGDIVGADLFDSDEWSHSANVRVLAREWFPGQPCRVEVEEWHP